MKKETFNDIMQSIVSFKGLSRDCACMLIEKYKSVPANTLHSILTEALVVISAQTSWQKLHSPITYFKRYQGAKQSGQPAGIILQMAAEIGLAPALLAKEILQYSLQLSSKEVSQTLIKKLMRDTTLITDGDLAYEVYLCILCDDKYGYIATAFGHSVGYEYEVKIKLYLNERNISFCDEEELQKRGYDKTPDFKLEVPIAVDGFVINWIESKARFGTERIHRFHTKKQYLSYWNRFGAGLVIYWFDYVDTLHQPNENKFIIMNDFPKNVTFLDTKIYQETESL